MCDLLDLGSWWVACYLIYVDLTLLRLNYYFGGYRFVCVVSSFAVWLVVCVGLGFRLLVGIIAIVGLVFFGCLLVIFRCLLYYSLLYEFIFDVITFDYRFGFGCFGLLVIALVVCFVGECLDQCGGDFRCLWVVILGAIQGVFQGVNSGGVLGFAAVW